MTFRCSSLTARPSAPQTRLLGVELLLDLLCPLLTGRVLRYGREQPAESGWNELRYSEAPRCYSLTSGSRLPPRRTGGAPRYTNRRETQPSPLR